jgi:hypothetical protein
MSRTVRHFSLHRIARTELRVIADIEDSGVLPFIQIEEAVIRAYIQHSNWPHRWVMLYILDDFQPLVHQLRNGISPAILETTGYNLTPESAAILNERPLVNLFDLSNLTGCNVFVNRRAMLNTGYWKDPKAIEALLAHEHAHPLAENETTRASRHLRIKLDGTAVHPANLSTVLVALAENLCQVAPREVFANQTTIQSGFAEALYHLDFLNLNITARGVAGRKLLSDQLQNQVQAGKLTEAEAGLILLGGDLSTHLPLAMEIAPFYRSGLATEAQKLEKVLNNLVFPNLDPLTREVFHAVQDAYIALLPVASGLMGWAESVMHALVDSFSQKGLKLDFELQIETPNES